MPSIKTNIEQKRALDEVSGKMSILSDINSLAPHGFSTVVIAFVAEGRGRKGVKIALSSGDKETQKILAAMHDYKKRLIKEVKEKAKKYDIDFDDSELQVLNGETTETAPTVIPCNEPQLVSEAAENAFTNEADMHDQENGLPADEGSDADHESNPWQQPNWR